MREFALVAGDFVRTGGMDAANYMFAQHLARANWDVNLVAFRVDALLLEERAVHSTPVARPFGREMLGVPMLARAGRKAAASALAGDGRALVNGGNAIACDINWLHYVHAAHTPIARNGALRGAVARWRHRAFLKAEHDAVQAASYVIANSERTRRDAIELLGVAPGDAHTVYYGTDAQRFRPPTEEERDSARAALGWNDDAPGIVFVGALGDRRKGFDSLFDAWRSLARRSSWDARLAVVGAGAEEPLWRERVRRSGLDARVQFLGFQSDVRPALWACDAIVAPSRYEAYGLAVHEAICCGLAPVVSRDAGIAELIPRELAGLQLEDPADAWEIDSVLMRWRSQLEAHRTQALDASQKLRARSWDDMSCDILRAIGEEC